MKLIPHVTKAKSTATRLGPVPEEGAGHAMWIYYLKHKL
jgi:hypothetical protein